MRVERDRWTGQEKKGLGEEGTMGKVRSGEEGADGKERMGRNGGEGTMEGVENLGRSRGGMGKGRNGKRKERWVV